MEKYHKYKNKYLNMILRIKNYIINDTNNKYKFIIIDNDESNRYSEMYDKIINIMDKKESYCIIREVNNKTWIWLNYNNNKLNFCDE